MNFHYIKKENMNHKQLDVWKESMNLAQLSFEITENLTGYLFDQIRKSAVSVPSNIAEGSGRRYTKEQIRFFNIALASLVELETQFILAQRLNYLKDDYGYLDLVYKVKKLILGTVIFFERKLSK